MGIDNIGIDDEGIDDIGIDDAGIDDKGIDDIDGQHVYKKCSTLPLIREMPTKTQ